MAIGNCGVTTSPQGRELKDHGTALFPVSCYGGSLEEHPVPWHWHDELEVVVVERGLAAVSVDGGQYALSAGQGIFISAGALHRTLRLAPGCWLLSIVFPPRIIGAMDSIYWQQYLQPLTANPACRCVLLDGSAPWSREAVTQVEAAWQSCVAEPPGFEFQARAALSWLIYLLSRHCPAAPSAQPEKLRRSGDRVKVMLQYIQAHYGEELTTAQIAASALVSESECLRCFRAVLDASPIQYLRQLRIQKAAELLEGTDQSVSEIGALCGFQEMSYFAKTFRELKGCTPSQYRKGKRSARPVLSSGGC